VKAHGSSIAVIGKIVGNTKVVVDKPCIRFYLQGCLIGLDCQVMAFLPIVDSSQYIVGLPQPAIQFQGPLEIGYSPVIIFFFKIGHAEPLIGKCAVGVFLQHIIKLFNGLIILVSCKERHPLFNQDANGFRFQCQGFFILDTGHEKPAPGVHGISQPLIVPACHSRCTILMAELVGIRVIPVCGKVFNMFAGRVCIGYGLCIFAASANQHENKEYQENRKKSRLFFDHHADMFHLPDPYILMSLINGEKVNFWIF